MKDPFFIRIVGYGVLALLACLLALYALPVKAQIPQAAAKWKRELTRQSHMAWGLDAPIATFAGQIEAESAWREDARSSAGAVGMAQFIPATSKWISGAYSALSSNDPENPIWALRALATYDKHLWDRLSGADGCNRMAFTLSAYNGGEARLGREQEMAASAGLWPEYWWDSVEKMNAGRSQANWKENRGYPRKILLSFEPRYVAAGWGRGKCSD